MSRPRAGAEISLAVAIPIKPIPRILLISLISLMSLIVMILIPGCQRRDLTPANPVARGRFVYQTNCAACHNADPTQPGVLGPPIEGSLRILIADRVTDATYPPGYRPKRTSHLMQRLPWITPRDIDDLTAFLASGTKSTDK